MRAALNHSCGKCGAVRQTLLTSLQGFCLAHRAAHSAMSFRVKLAIKREMANAKTQVAQRRNSAQSVEKQETFMFVLPVKAARAVPDLGHDRAFAPSPLSRRLFTVDKSDLGDADYPDRYRGGRWKILVIGSDQRYLKMDNDTFFSTGNHPIETLLPMYHLDQAGFGFDIATLSGDAVQFEEWAMPTQDVPVATFRDRFEPAFTRPEALRHIVETKLGADSDYIGVFIPGGHGALMQFPDSADMRAVLQWAVANDRFIISLCHGPAAFLALGQDNPLRGRKIAAFSDIVDGLTPAIGYMPGKLTWKFGERLKAQGFTIVNKLVSGATHQDGRLLTGDSPLASNALGKMAATALLKAVPR